MSEPAPANEPIKEPVAGITDADVDEAIAACGGDPREAVRALLIAGQFMEVALEAAQQEVSWGFVRGRPSRRVRQGQEARDTYKAQRSRHPE